jgi:hypothetical protein
MGRFPAFYNRLEADHYKGKLGFPVGGLSTISILKEFFMKKFSLLVLVVMLAAFFTMMGCVTMSSVGGTADMHGLFSGGAAKAAVTDGAQEIASYSNILGLFDSGYADYVAKVNAALAAGKKVTTTQTWLFVMFKHTAYAK